MSEDAEARPWDVEGQHLSFMIYTDIADDELPQRLLSHFMRSARTLSTDIISGVVHNKDNSRWYSLVSIRVGNSIDAHIMERSSKLDAEAARLATLDKLDIDDADPIRLPPRGQA